MWPEDWRHGIVHPIFKRGAGASRADVNDYRPITLTSCLSKLLELMILGRLMQHCEQLKLLAEEQCGFRKGRSTLDQIFTLHEIIASRKEHKLITYLAFLDCRRACDRVWRDGALFRLIQCGVKGRMLQFLASMISINYRKVVVQG